MQGRGVVPGPALLVGPHLRLADRQSLPYPSLSEEELE